MTAYSPIAPHVFSTARDTVYPTRVCTCGWSNTTTSARGMTTSTRAHLNATTKDRRALDATAANLTAYPTLRELVEAPGAYRPTLPVKTAEQRRLADAYDLTQELRGDARRAYRRG